MSSASQALHVAIDRRSDLPVGVQLTWALQSRILTGELAAGTRLPALHRLAAELGVNVNTVRAAYARLEQDGLVEIRHGTGTFVRDAPDGRANLADALAQAAQAASDAGVSAKDVAAALYVGAAPKASVDPGLRRRRELRAEITVLERALSEALVARRAAQPVRKRSPRASTPRLLSVEELEAQRDHLLQQLAAARTGVGGPPDDSARGVRATHTPAAPNADRPARRQSNRVPRVTLQEG